MRQTNKPEVAAHLMLKMLFYYTDFHQCITSLNGISLMKNKRYFKKAGQTKPGTTQNYFTINEFVCFEKTRGLKFPLKNTT